MSEMSAARPFLAKNCIRLPANQENTSSGLPCRYRLMLVWKSLWETVLIFTVLPDLASYALSAASIADLSTGSEWFEPNETVLPPAPPAPVELSPPEPQAASRL